MLRTPARQGVRLLIGLLAPSILSAQTITLRVGDSSRVSVAPGTKLTVPLVVDLSDAPGTSFASLQGAFSWGVGRLRLDSIRPDPVAGFTLTSNTANVAAGSLDFSLFSNTGLGATGPLARLYFTAGTTAGGTQVALTPTDAGNALGTSLLDQLDVEPLSACVMASSFGVAPRWGDANANGGVNVVDAQQIARYVVGLTVSNVGAVEERGDVTADGRVSILDAQQISRWTVGLTASARINTAIQLAGALPPVATLEVSPSPLGLLIGRKATLQATPRDSVGGSLAGCYPVSWSSSATGVATVSSAGLVTAKAAGTARITATVEGKSIVTTVLVTSATGLRAFYPMTGSVQDSSGQGRHGTAGPGFGYGTDRLGAANRAASFGGGTWVDLPAAAVDSLPQGTVSLWVNWGGGDGLQPLLAKQRDGVNTYAVLSVSAPVDASGAPGTGTLGRLYWHPRNGIAPLASSASLTAGRWQHVAVVWSATAMRMYLDGVEVGQAPCPCDVPADRTSVVTRLGRWQPAGGDARSFPGALDEVRVYGTALSASQVGLLAAERPAPVVSVVVAPDSVTVVKDQTQLLTATLRDSAGTVLAGREVTWTSRDPTVATVAATGLVTAVHGGRVLVMAASEGKTDTAVVRVPGPDYSGQDLSGQDLSRKDFRGANFTSANLAQTLFQFGDLRWADFTGASLKGSNSWYADMRETKFAGVDLTESFMYNVDLRGSNLVGANLSEAALASADLGQADLTDANLSGARLGAAKLTDAILTRTVLTGAWFDYATTWPAGFILTGRGLFGPGLNYDGQILAGKRFWGATFTDASFVAADLSGAYLLYVQFQSAKLERANLSGSVLGYADLTNASLQNADLTATNLDRAKLEGAVLTGATLTGAFVFGANLTNATLTNANLTNANLHDADLTGAVVTGATWTGAAFNSLTKWPVGFNPAGKGMWGPGLDYSGQDLSGRVFQFMDFAGASFANANLTGTNLDRAKLEGAVLTGATLTGAFVFGANLTNATLTNARLQSSDLTGATLNGATLTGATYNAATKWPAGFDPVAAGAVFVP